MSKNRSEASEKRCKRVLRMFGLNCCKYVRNWRINICTELQVGVQYTVRVKLPFLQLCRREFEKGVCGAYVEENEMKTIPWNKRYELGVELIDKQHKQLFATINKLLTLGAEEEKKEWVCREGVKYMKNHVIEHFQDEEAYMRSIDYPELEIHKRLHDNFQNVTLPSLEEELEESRYSEEAMRHFLGVSIGWLVAHTQTEDLAIAGKQTSQWKNISSADELDVLEQVLVQLGKDMFQFKAKPISRQYGGEEIGKTVCYRFVYRGNKKERWEIIWGIEEGLLLKVVSDLMGTQYLKVDDMVINITRYIARQLIEKTRECFPHLDEFEMEGEALLTHDQLADTFERVPAFCSLLFDTGAGYFTFSVFSASADKGKIVFPINAQNAMGQIKKYLQGEMRKKQILIVDDSDFMRSNLVRLLGEDYDVVESNSSIAAIKSITVNRPDLVLLDYEMPICDGRQALEMIRSEEDIADIPVVFLTGRGDAESVKKVMSLKPRGYLLKTMPEDDIKKYVDGILNKK